MTNKEFSKLRRQDLLQLLLTQGREAKLAEEQIEKLHQQCSEAQQTYVRLVAKLDEKDHQIEKLKKRLGDKDGTISEMKQTQERLKEKLNDKDRQLEKLIGRLDSKDATIQALRRSLVDTQTPEDDDSGRRKILSDEKADRSRTHRRA